VQRHSGINMGFPVNQGQQVANDRGPHPGTLEAGQHSNVGEMGILGANPGGPAHADQNIFVVGLPGTHTVPCIDDEVTGLRLGAAFPADSVCKGLIPLRRKAPRPHSYHQFTHSTFGHRLKLGAWHHCCDPIDPILMTTRETSSPFSGPLPSLHFNMARYCLAQSAAESPDKVALVIVRDPAASPEQTEQWTYRALEETVRRVAAGLLAAGVKPGDRLMIRLPNTSAYAMLFFGALAAGIVPLPASSQLTDEEAAFLFADCGAAAIALGAGVHMETGAAICFDEVAVAALMEHSPQEGYADTTADDPAYLVYTSGTSGRPKGVLHAHRAAWGRRPMYQGWYGMKSSDVMLHAGAFNWTYTLGVGLTDPWANGATTVLYTGERDIQVWPRLLQRYKATLFAAVPSLYRQILKYCDLSAVDLTHFRHGLTAGEALSATLLDNWRKATGTDLYEALGMSECSTYISTGPEMEIRVGSPGRPQPGRSIVVLDVSEGDVPLPVGDIGMLAIHRSDPGLMLGYWNRPDEDAIVYRGDWFIGGDLARFDDEGYLWYEGRADDVMNAMGYRVSPLEVEIVLSAHDAVAEVGVCEVTVRTDVSIIAAFVVPKAPGDTDAASILAHAAEHLAAYKCPREVIFVEHLPHSANGKLLRRELARSYKGSKS